MGLVNSLIADHGRRVLLVTDEAKLLELIGDAFWKDQNEKVVGRRVLIESDFQSVIQQSVNKLPNGPTKTLFISEIPDLLEIARISGVRNLRNLTWAIHNATAFVDTLIADEEIPRAHIVWTMKLVVATTLWIRSGLLDGESLEKLPGLSRRLAVRSFTRSKDTTEEDLELKGPKSFSDTFAVLSVDAPPLDYIFIRDFEKSGVIDGSKLILWVKQQFGFGKAHREASWRKLWYSHERPISETDQAFKDLQVELAARQHVDQGPILHCAGLALRFQEVGNTTLTNGVNVVEYFKNYIDEVASKGVLEKSSYDPSYASYESYGGLGFSARETDEFKEILGHLLRRAREAAVVDLEARASAVIAEAEAGDLDALYKLVRSDDRELSQNPVLLNFPVDRLAKFMAQDVPALSAGAKMLAYRYHDAKQGAPLFQEIKWARRVYEAVLAELKLWDEPHRALAIESLNGVIRHYERDRQPDDMIIPLEQAADVDGRQ